MASIGDEVEVSFKGRVISIRETGYGVSYEVLNDMTKDHGFVFGKSIRRPFEMSNAEIPRRFNHVID